MSEPEASYAKCDGCSHPSALHDDERGCRCIVDMRCKQGEDNVLCGCTEPFVVGVGRIAAARASGKVSHENR